jgi:hypothetical protein
MSEILGNFLGGQKGMGQADDVPATINGETPAALSEGEFVIPADVVSALGDGNTKAGAAILQQMVDEIRKSKTGSSEQPKRMEEIVQ